MKHSDETADLETLDSLKEDLAIIKTELEDVSRNIQRQRDVEDEHMNLTASAASQQTWMSILKMMVVIGICVVQVFLVTQHFQGAQNKRHQVDPFASGMI